MSRVAFSASYSHGKRVTFGWRAGPYNKLNEVMRRMTVMASALAVATLVASNYGMNFKHMPELEWPAGYAFAILLMIVASSLTLAVFKWKRYF